MKASCRVRDQSTVRPERGPVFLEALLQLLLKSWQLLRHQSMRKALDDKASGIDLEVKISHWVCKDTPTQTAPPNKFSYYRIPTAREKLGNRKALYRTGPKLDTAFTTCSVHPTVKAFDSVPGSWGSPRLIITPLQTTYEIRAHAAGIRAHIVLYPKEAWRNWEQAPR